MKHEIHIAGYGFSLRPVELEDAEFIIETRTPHRSRFMNQIERTIEAQRKWLEDYFQRPNDYYFVVERNKDQRQEGLVGLLDFDDTSRSAQMGRLIVRPDSRASAETGLLILRIAFGAFDLNEVWGTVMKENSPMIAFLRFHGFEKQQEIVASSVNGKVVEQLKYVLTRDHWEIFEKKIVAVARSMADKLRSS